LPDDSDDDSKNRHPRDEYIRTILSPNSWGGAIELTILAAHYKTEIASIDVETGRIDRFTGSGTSSSSNGDADADAGASESRALLIYSGIHYDAAVLAPTPDAPQEFCASVVPGASAATNEGERVVEALQALATKLRAKRAYTNTATFDLKCEVRVFARILVVMRDR
jgi:ubiquitin thioesterase OTU1